MNTWRIYASLVRTAFAVLLVLRGNSQEPATPAEALTDPVLAPQPAPTLFPVEDYTGDIWARTRLFGDLGGARTRWANHGFQFRLNLTQTYQDVFRGGKNDADLDGEFGGNIDLELKLDTGQAGMWPGGFTFLRSEILYKDSVNGETGALLPVSLNTILPEPDDADAALSHFYHTQFLAENLAISFGKLDTTTGDANAFAHGRGDNQFLNTAFGFNPVIALTVPYAALGAAIIFLPAPTARLNFAAIDTEGSPMTSGFDSVFDGGTTYSVELRLTTKFFGKPGHHLFGATYSDGDFLALAQRVPHRFHLGLRLQADDEFDPTERIGQESSSWSVYYNFDQYVQTELEDPTQGWGIFGRVGVADDDTNPIESFFSVGIGGKGIFSGRDHDQFGIGLYYMDTSDELPDFFKFEEEIGVEAFYTFAATPWLQITPDLQVIGPANKDNETVWVAGIRVQLLF